MLSRELAQIIESGNLAPVYLFLGESQFLIDEAWSAFIEKMVPVHARRFNGERLSARDITALDVISRLRDMPMFGPRRLIMVQHVSEWLKDDKAALLDYIGKPSRMACLVLASVGKKGIEKIELALSSSRAVLLFSNPTDRDAPQWTRNQASRLGKTLTGPAALYLVEQTGTDLQALDAELEKLVAYVGDRTSIDLEDAFQVVSGQRTHTSFQLMDHVIGRDAVRAVAVLRDVLDSGEEPLRVLGLLARQVRIVWQVRDGLDRRMGEADIARRCGLPGFVLRKYRGLASKLNQRELAEIHRKLRAVDIAMKSTGTDPDLLLEEFIMGLCLKNT